MSGKAGKSGRAGASVRGDQTEESNLPIDRPDADE